MSTEPKNETENEFGRLVFAALSKTEIGPIAAIQVMQKISGALMSKTVQTEEDGRIAVSMAMTWLENGFQDMEAQDAIDKLKKH